jgi:glycosyltransferase involved in cell wall biosynthesis
MDDVAVVIPTLNEVESIGAVVSELRRCGVVSILVADGGSTDGTREAATRAGARVIDAGKGYGRACLAGAQAAQATFIVFMDGDGADDPACLPELLDPVRAGTHDFAIGSRWRGRREPGSMSLHQIAAGLIIGGAIRLLYGVGYTDMCAFRVIRRDRLLALDMREMTYGWNLEMQLRVAKARLRILEVPVPCRRRIGGRSNVSGSFRGTLRAGSHILSTFYRHLVDRRPPTAEGARLGPSVD